MSDIHLSAMKVSVERKRPLVKKLFGGTKEADYESALVTIHFSDEEKQTIKQNRLEDRSRFVGKKRLAYKIPGNRG